MDLKQIAKDTCKTVISYLTYQSVRTVIAQLSETDPPQAFWLQQFSSRERIQDGEAYLSALFQERKDLAFRILILREHLAEEVMEYLPEMVNSGIKQSNMQHRAQQFERLTQLEAENPEAPVESENFETGSLEAGSLEASNEQG